MITLCRYIRHRELLRYVWLGWDVAPLPHPHGQYSYLATREERR